MTQDHHTPRVPGFFTEALREFKGDIRTLLGEHKEAITKRLTAIEVALASKSDRDYVNLLITNIKSDLEAQAADIEKLEAEISKKMNTESMWKLVSIALAILTVLGGLVSFLIQKGGAP